MSDQSEYFSSHAYYRFHHKNRPNQTLAIISENSDDLGMFPAFVTTASENWQIYYQQGRWFIRPYATSSDKTRYMDYQMGLSEDDGGNVDSVPSVAKRSGELGQQWTFTRVDDEEGGFGYKISNGLRGNTSWLSLTGSSGPPGMQSSSEGTIWDIQINPDPKEPANPNSYQDVKNFEVAIVTSSTSSSGSSTSTGTPSMLSTLSSSLSSTSTTPTGTPAIDSSSMKSASPNTAAIAGMAVGIAVFAILAISGAYLLIARRRKKQAAHAPPAEVATGSKVTYAYEIDSPQVVHMAQERGFQEPRYELSNGGDSQSSMPTSTEQKPRGLV